VRLPWLYEHTQSVALAQPIHLSSTGALVVVQSASRQARTGNRLIRPLRCCALGAITNANADACCSARKVCPENVISVAQAPAREADVPVFAAIISTW
jgi:hypothetical protein